MTLMKLPPLPISNTAIRAPLNFSFYSDSASQLAAADDKIHFHLKNYQPECSILVLSFILPLKAYSMTFAKSSNQSFSVLMHIHGPLGSYLSC